MKHRLCSTTVKASKLNRKVKTGSRLKTFSPMFFSNNALFPVVYTKYYPVSKI